MVGVAREDLADDPLGVEAEAGVGEVDLLPGTPGNGLTGAALSGDLRIETHQPRRYGVRGRPEHDRDAALVGTVEHGLQPVEVEDAVVRFPGRPHGLADPDHREAGL